MIFYEVTNPPVLIQNLYSLILQKSVLDFFF
jgi:hypothetical protein